MRTHLVDATDILTPVFWPRNKVENEAQADNIPFLAILLFVHEQEILFDDRGMAGMQVHGRRIDPRGTGLVVIREECAARISVWNLERNGRAVVFTLLQVILRKIRTPPRYLRETDNVLEFFLFSS